MIGRAPAATTVGGSGVGPGTIRIGLSAPTLAGAGPLQAAGRVSAEELGIRTPG